MTQTSPIAVAESLDVLFRTMERRDRLSAAERAVLADACGEVRAYANGDALVRAHDPVEVSILLLDGFIGREFHTPSGKRQIVAAHVPGDFVDLHGMPLKKLDHDVVALSDVRVAIFPHDRLRRITEEHPHLTRMLWLMTTIDAAIHREWLARLGHSAAVRVAQLLCELQMRLSVVGRCHESGFALDLTQADIGDMTGLTAIHVNRTLRKLREADLAMIRGGTVTIPDLAKLRAFASFDPTCLYLEPEPR